MARLAYKIKQIDERHIASLLVSGFTWQLKNWWDNALTILDKITILDHTVEENEEQGNIEIQHNARDFLIVTITMYFTGNPNEELNASKVFLTNLRCPMLTDFRWYKDMVLTNDIILTWKWKLDRGSNVTLRQFRSSVQVSYLNSMSNIKWCSYLKLKVLLSNIFQYFYKVKWHSFKLDMELGQGVWTEDLKWH